MLLGGNELHAPSHVVFCMNLKFNFFLTLEPYPKKLMLPVPWGPFGPQSLQRLPINENVKGAVIAK